MIKAVLRFLVRLLFRLQPFNEAVLKTSGPVLLIPNHVSWLDWVFIGVCLEDDWRFVVSSSSAQVSWLHRKIMLNRRTFPIDTMSPYAAKHMAAYLEGKGRLVLFAEGRLSRTGTLMKLFDGTGFLLHKTEAKIITCYVRGAHRLPFSPNRDRKKLFPRVTAHFSEVLTAPQLERLNASTARARLTEWLRDKMLLQQFQTEMEFGPPTVPEAIIATARERPRHIVIEDITQGLRYRRLLVGANLLAERFQNVLPQEHERVGVLLPNVNANPVTLLALWLIGKVPAVLNFSTGARTMLACARLAGLTHVITSRSFLDRAKLDVQPLLEAGLQFTYLEDLRQGISFAQKLLGILRVRSTPGSLVRNPQAPGSTAVVLFTSGSEGMPKGVELTHENILSNIRQMLAVCDMQDWDRIFNALPLFHSFGLTVGTLLPLVRGLYISLYPSPLHYRVVPTMFYHRDCTIMLGTNTFLNGYARKAHPMDFRSLRYMFAGAEKVQENTMNIWGRHLGVRILEGYGATECSPCISVNTPMLLRHGTAGRLLPAIEYKLEPVSGVETGGRLFVRGPNVMRGYLNPDANAKFQALNGWYDTGDIASVDSDGFVFIQGRLKRFAKISGEMVSLTAVEEALAGAFPKFGLRCQIAVVARPDPSKGEALIAISNEPRLGLEEMRAAIRAQGLPNIYVPREVRFMKEIPRLGTGKVNHRELEGILAREPVPSEPELQHHAPSEAAG
jgi:acyl-[acyl-carrier-protein]-phospholipid O-acyltransferase/long-chain-fatty-acid--[acyl-carrier-protein] ligase